MLGKMFYSCRSDNRGFYSVTLSLDGYEWTTCYLPDELWFSNNKKRLHVWFQIEYKLNDASLKNL